MASTTAYRYTLQPYGGPSSRHTCPACAKPRTFTRYVDTDTGELLPEEFGRCDRDANCGYHLNPYRAGPAGSSYAKQSHQDERPATRSYQLTPPAVVSLPDQIVTATLGHYQHNALACLLRKRLGLGVADEVVQRFRLGTSTHWPGACIFWLIDEKGRTRGGQVVLYDEHGATVKQPHRHLTWAHTALAQKYEQQTQPAPDWLTKYAAHGQKSPCLFGLPQLADAPTWQPVAIVESAKTAILASCYLPQFTWLATMGCSYLTADRLEPLRGRRILLWPDVGAFDKWQAKAAELRGLGFTIEVSDLLEKQGLQPNSDLADIWLNEWPGYPPSWDGKE